METLDELKIEELKNLACKADKILKEELEKENIDYILAEARIYNVKTVGVQGDYRTYCYPAEITLYQKENFVWNEDFLSSLSTRITNEIKEINRVVYLIGFKNKKWQQNY